ncbi:hypothetical protein V1477_011291 [Vespula maculifrons]|uniref:Uncharacterized protein n=1 Tax=Vespula maculifrons TaxID=7453 RepID=A0ABD2C4E4_VESMC
MGKRKRQRKREDTVRRGIIPEPISIRVISLGYTYICSTIRRRRKEEGRRSKGGTGSQGLGVLSAPSCARLPVRGRG